MKKKKAPSRYMDLKTDFAFKYVFANENDKSMVINLLNEILSDKVQLVTLELGKFNKTEEELETNLDYWMYCFKHAQKLRKQPKKLQGEIFNKLFNRIDTENLTDNNMETYNKSIKEYPDVRFVAASNRKMGYNEGIEIGIERGIERGIEVGYKKGCEGGKLEVAKKLLDIHLSVNDIAKATGLTPAQIRQMKE
jgi:predicted transposase/invertase (TIGR01784 family)